MSVNDQSAPRPAQYSQPSEHRPASPPPEYRQPPPPVYGGPAHSTAPSYTLQRESFTSKAIVTLVLYFVLWVPGLIANLVFFKEAKNTKDRCGGQAPEGYGCLTAMLAVQAGAVLLICAFLGLTALGAAGS